ncbi:pirin family protein [Streptomyces sp. P38-E01]|uniref:Pirin family protein n=1 Tax=Streptomyces tardus TaxID=2780544 RepID=A0A949JR44_9ACTN|nr:pirin family protein [Streptomyces tardus]MBU7598690.1 pirin family protein [Streptomyces tardus]
MSNVEPSPAELRCADRAPTAADDGPAVEILTPRDVPLGGPRAITVRRTLPQRVRSLIGAWCFVDHFGPTDVAVSGNMDVPPHPHTGLQTVSWLFSGEVEHRDSTGVHAFVRPGELNLMTGGHGVCHSEVSTGATTVLHGVQLWVALPDAHRGAPRDFRSHVPEPLDHRGATVRVFLGELCGSRSPVPTFSPLLGAELLLPPGTELALEVDPEFEHGVLVDTGGVDVAGESVAEAELAYLAPGSERIALANNGRESARLILLGGPPFGEEIIMWWNFVARSHEEVVEARTQWEAESDRFGAVTGYSGRTRRLPAPQLPGLPLRPRGSAR